MKDYLRNCMFSAFFAIFLVLFILTVAHTAFAQNLYVLGGLISSHEDRDTSYSWQISYMEDIGNHFGWSFSWLNEGHMPEHHRDGPTLQLWAKTSILKQRLSFAAGAGPYLAFDTQHNPDGRYINKKNGGGIFSLAAIWDSKSRWLIQARVDSILVHRNIDTTAFSFGIGYKLDPGPSAEAPRSGSSKTRSKMDNEITGFLGRSIINGPHENSFSFGIEYRRGIARYLDWTVGYIDEGDNAAFNRKGIATQFWPKKSFFDDDLTLGVGVGAYLAVDKGRNSGSDIGDDAILAGLITVTGSYHLSQEYRIRISWSRVMTDYDRDTDIIFVGLGYHF